MFLWHAATCAAATLERIDLDGEAGALRVVMSQRTPFKVLRLDAREIMVAFKSADLAPEAAGSHIGSGSVKRIAIEKLPDQVVSLMIESTVDIGDIQARWQQDTATLQVVLATTDASAPPIPVKQRKFKKGVVYETVDEGVDTTAVEAPESVPPPSPETAEEPVLSGQLPAPIQTGETSLQSISNALTLKEVEGQVSAPGKEAVLDDFVTELSRTDCADQAVVADALALCKTNQWSNAFELLNAGVDPAVSGNCQSERYYLRAYAAFKMNTSGDDRLYLDAENYFQDALSYYPNTPYAPFATLALATIYDELDRNAEARGYLNLILKKYPDHPVAAEALFKLGQLYVKEQKQEEAVTAFRRYLEQYPKSSRLINVRLALGKSLYELDEFADALDMLTRVVEEDPRCIYEDPDLLVYMGNLYYQLGNLESAREMMTKAVNLYPENEVVPDLLTRIGDTYKESGQTDRAKKIYGLVMSLYPNSDGFAMSAIRFAGLLSDPSEKEAQYRMVIDRFPGHPMAKLAQIRLADLQCKAGAYSESIETLRNVMSGDLKKLQDEAEYVMATSYQGLFRQLADGSDFLGIIAAYEKDRGLINRLENPDLFEMIGAAFFAANFYNQAEELYQKAYKASSPSGRPASLYYRLAVTLQELGKNMQAREMFHAYFQKIPEDEKNPEAYLRMAQLLAAEESWESALAFIRTGLGQSISNMQEAQFLMVQAKVYAGLGKEVAVPDLLIRAINRMASSPDVTNEQLTKAHRDLGESYMKLSLFEEASDAFAMALKLSGESRSPDLLYLQAESELKAKHPEAARAALSEILVSGDNFWVRMAQEQLRAMELEKKMELQGLGQTSEFGSQKPEETP